MQTQSFFKKIGQDKIVQHNKISELQNEDLKLEQTLNKRSDNHERLLKTLTVDEGLYENILKENESLKDTISNINLEVNLKTKNLNQKKADLDELLDIKKSIENRVKSHE